MLNKREYSHLSIAGIEKLSINRENNLTYTIAFRNNKNSSVCIEGLYFCQLKELNDMLKNIIYKN